jgi:hypothetical protein
MPNEVADSEPGSVSTALLDALEAKGREVTGFESRDERFGIPASGPPGPSDSSGRITPENPPQGKIPPEEEDVFSPDERTLQALGLIDPPVEPQSEADGQEGGEPPQPTTDLSTLARSLGLEESDILFEDGRVFLKTKVDGREERVSADELRKGYQLQSHFTRQNEEFIAKQREWEMQAAQAAQAFNQQAELALQVLGDERQRLDQHYTRDWNALRQEDPAEWAAQMAEYNNRVRELDSRQGQIAYALEEGRQKAMANQRARMAELASDMDRKLSSQMGWNTQDKLKVGKDRLLSYLGSEYGYTPQELESLVDHRAFILSEKARLYDEMKARVSDLRKKISIPGNPGSRQAPAGSRGPSAGKAKRLAQAKQRLAETNSVDALADVISELNIA